MTSIKNLSLKHKAIMADLAILLAAVLWGGDYLFAKTALEKISPGYMNAIRFSVCALIMIPFLWKRIIRIKRPDLLIGILTGVMMFGGFIGQTAGLVHTSVGNNAFITSAYVIFVPFIAWAMTKIRPKANNFLAILFCIVGIGMLTLQGGLSLSKGDSLTMMGAVFFGFELALLGIYAKKIDPLVLAFVEAATVAVLFITYSLIFEEPPKVWDRPLILSMAYLTFFGSVLTHITVTVALKYTSSSHGAVLCSTESVFGVILAVLFLGEKMSLQGVIGCLFVLAAVLIAEVGEGIFNRRRSLDG